MGGSPLRPPRPRGPVGVAEGRTLLLDPGTFLSRVASGRRAAAGGDERSLRDLTDRRRRPVAERPGAHQRARRTHHRGGLRPRPLPRLLLPRQLRRSRRKTSLEQPDLALTNPERPLGLYATVQMSRTIKAKHPHPVLPPPHTNPGSRYLKRVAMAIYPRALYPPSSLRRGRSRRLSRPPPCGRLPRRPRRPRRPPCGSGSPPSPRAASRPRPLPPPREPRSPLPRSAAARWRFPPRKDLLRRQAHAPLS